MGLPASSVSAVILLFPSFISSFQFICDDGSAIFRNQTCDGVKHCPDYSDETKKLCYHIICIEHQFRCHYGACINVNLRCNKIQDCVDNSDEFQCRENWQKCRPNQFECVDNKQCISIGNLCDGKINCKDNSDEDPDMCDTIACPSNTHRCKVGGCINLHQRCNGNNDCIDGSDESEILCKSLKCTGEENCKNVQKSIVCSAITSTRIRALCDAPNKGIVPCNKPLPVGTKVQYECKPYYVPASTKHINNKKMECQPDGNWNKDVLKCKPDCGKSEADVIPLILNGWYPDRENYPWHAVLFNLESGNWTFICGGSLITETVVLTAAHCTWSVSAGTLRIGLAKVYSDYYKPEEHSIIRDVSDIIKQPLYQDYIGNYGSDLAILILNQSVEFSSFLRPICIDWNLEDISHHLIPNKLGMIVGMGITEKNSFSDIIKATYLPIVSDELCIKQQNRDFKKYVTFTSFCAGWRNGSGVCNGDSGGGLVFPSQKDPNRWTLQGIVSVSPRKPGTSFCDPGFCTVFTKVGIYVEWIYRVLLNVHVDMHNPFENDVVF